MKKALLTIGTVILTGVVSAQSPGDLDLSFGVGGYTLTDGINNTGESFWDLLVLSNDKIVKIGYSDDGGDTDILIARFLADGTPDSTFNGNGFATFDLSIGGSEDARGACEVAGDKLLITGYVQSQGSLDAYVMQLNEDGTIDNTFGTNSGYTKLNTGDNLIAYGKSVVEYGGEIYVGGAAIVNGQSDLFVCNLTGDGNVDNSFSSGGYGTKDIEGGNDHMMKMDVTSNGSFVFGGYADSSGVTIGYVAALSQFGTPTIFGTNGSYHQIYFGSGSAEVNDLFIDANNKIVVTGDEGPFPDVNGFVLRLATDGTLDATFGTNGMVMSDPGATTALFFRGVSETFDGGIIACGNFDGASQDLYALLLTENGGLNGAFGGNGDVIIPMSINTNTISTMGCGVQANGKIVLGGFLTSQDFVGENMFIVRLIPFASAGIEELTEEWISVYPNPVTTEFHIDNADVNEVELIDINGMLLQKWTAQTTYAIPNGLASGVYLVRVKTEQAIGLARIMIK